MIDCTLKMGPHGIPHQPTRLVSSDHLMPSVRRHELQKMPLDAGRRRVMTTALSVYMNEEARNVESTLPHFRHLTVMPGVWSGGLSQSAIDSLCATTGISAKSVAA